MNVLFVLFLSTKQDFVWGISVMGRLELMSLKQPVEKLPNRVTFRGKVWYWPKDETVCLFVPSRKILLAGWIAPILHFGFQTKSGKKIEIGYAPPLSLPTSLSWIIVSRNYNIPIKTSPIGGVILELSPKDRIYFDISLASKGDHSLWFHSQYRRYKTTWYLFTAEYSFWHSWLYHTEDLIREKEKILEKEFNEWEIGLIYRYKSWSLKLAYTPKNLNLIQISLEAKINILKLFR